MRLYERRRLRGIVEGDVQMVDDLLEMIDSLAGAAERDARGVEFGFHIARTETDLEASAAELIDGCEVACEQRGTVEGRVEYEVADPQVRCLRGSRDEGRHRPDEAEMVGHENDIGAGIGDSLHLRTELISRAGSHQVDSETDTSSIWRHAYYQPAWPEKDSTLKEFRAGPKSTGLPAGHYASTMMTCSVRGPWTPSTRSSSMSLVALGPLIQVWGRIAEPCSIRRATASGTSLTI